MKHPGFGFFNIFARLGLMLFVKPLRSWDKKAAKKADFVIANSNFTKDQISKYYGRDSVVIHPPVDTNRFKPKAKSPAKHGFLIAGRQTPYKRFDLAVEACTNLDVPLKVIGDGPDHRKLVTMAGPRVTFQPNVSDSDMPWHFHQASAFIFPGIDDFGIVAVEALAAGTPVIAFGQGGALDYVTNKTGVTFEEQSSESLAAAISKFDAKHFKTKELIAAANKFSEENFRKNIKDFINLKSKK